MTKLKSAQGDSNEHCRESGLTFFLKRQFMKLNVAGVLYLSVNQFVTLTFIVILTGLAPAASAGIVTDSLSTTAKSGIINFIYSSDQHYGLTKTKFQGNANVSAKIVNAALAVKMNTLSGTALPADGGVGAGKTIDGIELFIGTGDIANRAETGIQTDSTSWLQFQNDYLNGLTLKKNSGNKIDFALTPGNHDISNAIGYYKTLYPPIDATTMTGMYNLMMAPKQPVTNAAFNYAVHKTHFSRDINGFHLQFLHFWPDSAERIWMNADLSTVSSSTPVLLFAHVPPDGVSRFFTNPNGAHDINSDDQFENQCSEIFKDGKTTSSACDKESRGFVSFLKAHTNVKAYFHGHNNYNEFYSFTGPDSDVTLPTFRVDSPMKGDDSESDETKLSFQFISIDTLSKQMTVRECLWDAKPTTPSAPLSWGKMKTISLATETNNSNDRGNQKPATSIALEQNYPNPFNNETRIQYSLGQTGQVKLSVVNILGECLFILVNEEKPAGTYTVPFNASSLPSGIYFCTLRTGTASLSRKLLLLK